MQRLKAIKVLPYLLGSFKSYASSSSHVISPTPIQSYASSLLPFSQATPRDRRINVRISIKPRPASTISSALAKEAMADTQITLLEAVNDLHGGVTVEVKEPMNPQVFASLLRASLSQWRLQDKKGVWIKLPIEQSNLVDITIKEGFKYHHAEPDYLMLVYWIPEAENSLPLNASHRVGIGAFVMNTKREVLVVREKSGKFKGTGLWKYPTGVVNEGEDICTAAIREVKEETGIDTEFVEVLAFRQSHKSFFTKSDLFFMCMLKPQSFDIQPQAIEIDDAKWMPVEEYRAQPFNQKNELFKLVSNICSAKAEIGYTGFSPYSTTTGSGKSSHLYFNNQFLDRVVTSDHDQ